MSAQEARWRHGRELFGGGLMVYKTCLKISGTFFFDANDGFES